jgi:hypothetical protein
VNKLAGRTASGPWQEGPAKVRVDTIQKFMSEGYISGRKGGVHVVGACGQGPPALSLLAVRILPVNTNKVHSWFEVRLGVVPVVEAEPYEAG